jgi:hypothetical protein
VLVAHGCHDADFSHAAEHLSCNIGAVRVVAQIFSEKFFAAVRSREAGLYCYRRNGRSPGRIFALSDGEGTIAQVILRIRRRYY